MPELHFPWLELAFAIPLFGAAVVASIKGAEASRRVAIFFSLLTLVACLGEWIDFNRLRTFEAHDQWDVVAGFMHQNVFVIDELSAPLLPASALLYLLVIYSTLRNKAARFFSLSSTLLSEAILLATLSCRSGWLLILLLALALVPVWFELYIRRKESVRVFLWHSGAFVVLMVFGYALLPSDAMTNPETPTTRTLFAGGALTLGALIRSGIAPFHCWITDLFDRATFGTALLTVAPMPGVYLLMRMVLPYAPSWALQTIAVFSLATAIYTSGMALVETDTRRFFCYLFLSHSTLVLAGLEIISTVGLTGALCLWPTVGLSLGGLGIVIRSIESRVGRVELSRFNGLSDHTPILAGLFLLSGLASIGFPGTVGFVGIELLVEGAARLYPLVGGAVIIATALCGVAVMRAYFRIFTGNSFQSTINLSARPSERIAVMVLAILILGGGLVPQPGVHSRHHAAMQMLRLRKGVETTRSDLHLEASQKLNTTTSSQATAANNKTKHLPNGTSFD